MIKIFLKFHSGKQYHIRYVLFMGTTKFIRLETSGWTRMHSEKYFILSFIWKTTMIKKKRTKMKQKINIITRRKFLRETA